MTKALPPLLNRLGKCGYQRECFLFFSAGQTAEESRSEVRAMQSRQRSLSICRPRPGKLKEKSSKGKK